MKIRSEVGIPRPPGSESVTVSVWCDCVEPAGVPLPERANTTRTRSQSPQSPPQTENVEK